MACQYHVLPEYKLCIFIASGEVTATEGIITIKSMTHTETWQAGFSILWDARQITSLDVDLVGATELIKVGRDFLNHAQIIRSAVVLKRELDVQFVSFLSKAITIKGAPQRQVEFFETLNQACAWLGVPVAVINVRGDADR